MKKCKRVNLETHPNKEDKLFCAILDTKKEEKNSPLFNIIQLVLLC